MKIIRKILIFILILLGIHYLYLNFINSDEFILENIEVKSQTELVEDDVLAKLQSIKGKKIGEIDFEKLSEFLKNDIRISSVEITKRPPHGIFVEIEEKKAYAYVVYNNKIYVCDDRGNIFAYWQETENRDLIILNIQNEKEIPDLISVMEIIDKFELKKKISSIFKVSQNEIRIVLDDSTIFKTSKTVDEAKYQVAGKLYKYLKSKDTKIDYIDIRFKDYIVK